MNLINLVRRRLRVVPKRGPKFYAFNGLAGCVVQRKSRKTGTTVGIYQANQAGMESDPESPWATVCEVHHTLVCHTSLKLAFHHAPDPTGWCEDCRTEERP